jgi:dihydrofolate reductase
MKLNLIVAMSKNKCIGVNNKLPWYNKEDFKHFAKTTIYNKNNAVIMGSNTFKSLNYKPLKNRQNIVLTRNPKLYNNKFNNVNDVKFFNKSQNIVDYCKKQQFDEAWVIGGNQIYSHFINNYKLNDLVISIINTPCYDGDVFATFLENKNLNIYNIKSIKDGKILYCYII